MSYANIFKLIIIFITISINAQAKEGRVERIQVHAKSLVGNLSGDSANRYVSIYLPPSYDRDESRHYPVVYLLHGFTNSDYRWYGLEGGETFVNVPVAANNAVLAGAREMILVTPDAFTKYQGSMYSNSVTNGNWETFIAEELVEYIDSHYRTIAKRESRGLGGHSSGGYGTFRIGMKYPGVFSSLYAMNPCCMKADLKPPIERMIKAAAVNTAEDILNAAFKTKAALATAAAWSPNPKRPDNFLDLPYEEGKYRSDVIASWAANAIFTMVHQYISNLKTYKAIALDAGDEETGIGPNVKAFSKLLNDYDIRNISEIYAGGHRDKVAERLEKNVLPFFSKNLSFK